MTTAPDPEFNDVEHFQSVVRKVINPVVREHFKDIDASVELANISTPRSSLRRACTHDDTDSLLMTVGKLNLYCLVVDPGANLPPIYGIPVTTFQETFPFAPQIKLFFNQSRSEIESDFDPVEGEITYHLVEETSATMTEAKAEIRAKKILALFAKPNLFIWHKGTLKVTYLDKKNGYDFRLLVTTESEAKQIIEQVLDIENKSPDWDNLTNHESKKTFPRTPPKQTIYGKSRKTSRRRPVENVKFRYAELHISGIPRAITLVDTTGRRGAPLAR